MKGFALANGLFKSADKGCLILIPHSDLLRPRDFYGFDRFEISHRDTQGWRLIL